MGRPRKRSLFLIAVSLDSAADALAIPRRVIADAIEAAELPALQGPGKRIRITVADLTEWVRTRPRATI
jgi:excisionase family DNA binding protein